MSNFYYLRLLKIVVEYLADFCACAVSFPAFQPLCALRSVLYIFHRRRIEIEEKAKVVASVWGAKFVKFLAAL